MSEPKWTPGPWRFDEIAGEIFSQSGETIADLDASSTICDDIERDANARLIAHAPELYDFIASLENDDGRVPAWLWKKRNTLLAKARGEA